MSAEYEEYDGAGMPKGNKPAGFVGLMIAKKHLGRTPDSYDPTAREKSTPELFDADLIEAPSKYIQTNLYAQSGRVRRGVKILQEATAKKRIQQVVKKFVAEYKTRPKVGQMTAEAQTDAEMKRFVDAYTRNGIEGLVYSATYLVGDMFFLHLLRKYKNDCIIAIKTKPSTGYLGTYTVGLSIKKDYTKVETLGDTAGDVAYAMKECVDSGKSIVAIPFLIPSHQNILIYRPSQNTIERFEPHGQQSPATAKQNEKMDKAIETFFRKKEFDPILRRPNVPAFRYLKPVDLRLGDGFQAVENKEDLRQRRSRGLTGFTYPGFCLMWAYFYLELVLKFPNLSGKEVIDKAFEALNAKGGTERFLRTVLGYAEDVERTIQNSIPNFSFANMTDTTVRGEFAKWFDNEIRTEMTELNKRVVARKRAATTTGAGYEMEGAGYGKRYIETKLRWLRSQYPALTNEQADDWRQMALRVLDREAPVSPTGIDLPYFRDTDVFNWNQRNHRLVRQVVNRLATNALEDLIRAERGDDFDQINPFVAFQQQQQQRENDRQAVLPLMPTPPPRDADFPVAQLYDMVSLEDIPEGTDVVGWYEQGRRPESFPMTQFLPRRSTTGEVVAEDYLQSIRNRWEADMRSNIMPEGFNIQQQSIPMGRVRLESGRARLRQQGRGLLMSSCCAPNRRECKVGGYYGGFMKGLEYVSRNF